MDRLDAAAFDGERLTRPGTWVVAFSADWCPICRMFLPKFASLDDRGSFRTAVADVTSDDSPLWETFQVDVVPTLVVFRDGQVIYREDGTLGRGLPESSLLRAAAATTSPRA